MREAEEGSGLLRSGVRFQQEKRQRIDESSITTATGTRGYEGRSDPTMTKDMTKIHPILRKD